MRIPMDELKQEIKECIISSLELEDITPENIVDSEPLFGTGLGLDSNLTQKILTPVSISPQ